MKPSEALSRAAALCSRSEYSEKQIREKLCKWDISPSDADTIIQQLYNEKFLDISRYCQAFCADKFQQNHWGKLKIAHALRLQGIPSDYIQKAISSIDEHEYRHILQHILNQKNKTLKDTNPYIRNGKLARHALSKGFESELIMQLIGEDF